MKKNLKIGNNEAFNLMNRPKRKFEKSIIVAGGISFYGLSDLMLLQGTMNDFMYHQALSFYKESYDSFKKNK